MPVLRVSGFKRATQNVEGPLFHGRKSNYSLASEAKTASISSASLDLSCTHSSRRGKESEGDFERLYESFSDLTLRSIAQLSSPRLIFCGTGQILGAALNTSPDPWWQGPSSFLTNFFFSPEARRRIRSSWQNGAIQDLGTLGGPDSVAAVVNEYGQVAGTAFTDFVAVSAGAGSTTHRPEPD